MLDASKNDGNDRSTPWAPFQQSAAVSQPVFARYLKVSKNLVSDWERGVKRPSGPALRLLAIVKKGGLAAFRRTVGRGPAQPAARSAERNVFDISIAMVIGPTPPGTGVIAAACLAAPA